MSHTFHGRDIFAPVAAHLSLGIRPRDLGRPAQELVWLTASRPVHRGNALVGEVVYADHFGNLVTNIPGQELENAHDTVVHIKGRRILRLSRTFQSPKCQNEGSLIALVGSLGYLEIAVRDGSAASALGASAGDRVRVILPDTS